MNSPDSIKLLELANSVKAEALVIHFASNNSIQVYSKGFHHLAREAGYKIAWLLPVPMYDTSVPSVLWKMRGASLRTLQPFNLTEIDQLNNQLMSDGVMTFDFRPLLCLDGCLVADDELKPYYFDRGHLTLTGANYLRSTMVEAVEWLSSGNENLKICSGRM